jgi:hypothetical protein
VSEADAYLSGAPEPEMSSISGVLNDDLIFFSEFCSIGSEFTKFGDENYKLFI